MDGRRPQCRRNDHARGDTTLASTSALSLSGGRFGALPTYDHTRKRRQIFSRSSLVPRYSVVTGEARNAYDGCGTFYGSDYFAQGCNYVIVGAPLTVTDKTALSAGDWIARARTPANNKLGQGGIGARYAIDELRSEAGLFYAHYNARNALPEISRTLRASTTHPFIPGNPDGGNPVYRTVFAPDIDMIGATWQTKLASNTSVSAEYVYRPNYALGFPAGEELIAAVSATTPSLLRNELNALAPGAFYAGYDRRRTGVLNVTLGQQSENLLGAKLASLSRGDRTKADLRSSRRIVRNGDRLVVENRAGSANLAETSASMDDLKRILVFSDAGGTGRSYHAELSARNRRLRVHYLLEPGWKADAAIQGLGRTTGRTRRSRPCFVLSRPT